jgi:hypothetical protein
MSSGLFPPFSALVAEGHQVFNVGADVIGLGAYVKERLELVRGQIEALPEGLRPKVRSPYA